MENANNTLQEITKEAVKAAQEGRWERVIELYHRRAQDGMLEQASLETTKKLIAWDRWMTERIKNVSAAAKQQLFDLQDKRRKLEVIKRHWAINTPKIHTRHLQTI